MSPTPPVTPLSPTRPLTRSAALTLRDDAGVLHVVLGHRSRLGVALLSRVGGDDRRELAAVDVPGIEDAAEVRVYVCALGPSHPVAAADDDEERYERELSLVRRVVRGAVAARTPVRVVHVSSVIALAPSGDRLHYGGWKQRVERDLRAVLSAEGATHDLAVVHPGRLVHDHDRGRPQQRLHTRYRDLADVLTAAVRDDGSRHVIGLDARLWLLARGRVRQALATPGRRRPTQQQHGER
ncbi:hypothetical protein [Nocardioides nanhaiensis]|uniref:SDR family NAD(P)-dependent oxidoreductase n=1 Tax=Nocardioides nanhaiensis TaxID=1476871 RepID=A0ABP8VWM7_9ACTN